MTCECGKPVSTKSKRFCWKCAKEISRELRAAGLMGRFPIDPFRRALSLRGISTFDFRGIDLSLGRALHRESVTCWTADKLACAIGLHPIDVWPDWIPEEIAA